MTIVEEVWRLRTDESLQTPDPSLLSAHAHPATVGAFDVLRALKVTTHAIRSVRNYLLSLPDEYGVSRSQHRQTSFWPVSLSTSEPQKRRVSSRTDRTDPLVRICHTALDVLTVLHELKESVRVPLSDVPTDSSFSALVMRFVPWP